MTEIKAIAVGLIIGLIGYGINSGIELIRDHETSRIKKEVYVEKIVDFEAKYAKEADEISRRHDNNDSSRTDINNSVGVHSIRI